MFKFYVYMLAEAIRYSSWDVQVKFNWEFVIIGRGYLVLLKFKLSLCWRMLFKDYVASVLNLLVFSPASLRADS